MSILREDKERQGVARVHDNEHGWFNFVSSALKFPRNVYLLLFFTLGKGFQLTIANLTLSYYLHSLGYKPDFIGLFTAMSSVGSMLGAIPVSMLIERIGYKSGLLLTALLTPICLALTAFATSVPLLLGLGMLQGVVAAAYWVTNLPLLTESTTEKQRVSVFALNSFLLLGVGSLGNLLGGYIPGVAGSWLHVSSAAPEPLRWGVVVAALFTFIFGLPLWFLRIKPRQKVKKSELMPINNETIDPGLNERLISSSSVKAVESDEGFPWIKFGQLLIPDLLFTTGEGAVVALIQIYFVLRFNLLPGALGIIFTFSGLVGGFFALMAPVFVRRWSKLRVVTIVQYVSAPLMILTGYAPSLSLAISGEYARSILRTLIEPLYSAFAMEQVGTKWRGRLMGLYSVTWSIGYSIGPSIAGWLQTNVNLSMAFVFGAACLLVTPTLLLIFFGRPARR